MSLLQVLKTGEYPTPSDPQVRRYRMAASLLEHMIEREAREDRRFLTVADRVIIDPPFDPKELAPESLSRMVEKAIRSLKS